MSREWYYEIPGLEHIYLEDSYVTDIVEDGDNLHFALDLILTEQHAKYEPPEVDETYCYRQAMLDFPAAKQITWLERHFIPFTDANNEQDFGNIDVFYRESDTYHLEGDWGVVEVRSAPPVLTISS